ncbi:MAG: CidA/LrgA family protein [Oleiphilaceae bacterium]|nr:CidA/LrgA family protein [Oleiphilaceae bacterium]
MVFGLVSLCLISVLATWLVDQLSIPIPGAIIGLLIVFTICVFRGKPGKYLERSSQTLTLYIPLLILPSCIGIMDHWHLIQKEWLAILVAICVSVLFTLITMPWLFAKLVSKDEREQSL